MLICIVFVGVTWLGIFAFHPVLRRPLHGDGPSNETIIFSGANFGLFYAVLLGLLTVETFQSIKDLRSTIDREASNSTPEIEEERRLLYVAMTRAKDHLHLIVPQRFYAHQQRNSGDQHMYALRTRFIPDAITGHFEQCAWPVPSSESNSPAVARLKSVPIGARLKQMWR